MFYTAFGIIEHFEDGEPLNSQENVDQPNENKDNMLNKNMAEEKENCLNTGFAQTIATLPQNIMHFTRKLNMEMYNLPIVDAVNISTFKNNTVAIQMNTIFDFVFSLVGSNRPFITNVLNFNGKNNNKITFKYKDQYGYDIDLISNNLINNALYNIIYLPFQPKIEITDIDVTNLNSFNIMNGIIITVDRDVKLTLPSNKIFEIYIYPLKKVNLVIDHFENKVSTFILEPNTYNLVYYNINNYDQITITKLNTVNLNFITIPSSVQLNDNSNLLYYNNFLNLNNNKFYNIVNKQYDTTLMNCSDCGNNIKQYGSRYKKQSYYGTETVYMKLPDLNLSNTIITFSINFKTIDNNNQILFDIGNISSDNKYITSLFVNFENNTVRFNYIKNNELKSTFLYAEGNPKLNDNNWHNIIWTLNNDKWTIYVDSNQILNANKKTPNKYTFYCINNYIGKKNNINSLYTQYTNFIGFIDNFKIFSKELTTLEIQNENIK